MNESSPQAVNERPAHRQLPQLGASPWVRPAFEVIPLDCEITAYAPDGDGPLF